MTTSWSARTTGSSHPCDEERWFDFICQTVDDGRVFDYDTLSKFLQDEEYWGKKEKGFLGVIGQLIQMISMFVRRGFWKYKTI